MLFFKNSVTHNTATCLNYLCWVVEEFNKSKIISCGDNWHVLGCRGGVDVCYVTLGRPQTLTGGTKDRSPGWPGEPLYLLVLQSNPLTSWSLKEQLLLGSRVHHYNFTWNITTHHMVLTLWTITKHWINEMKPKVKTSISYLLHVLQQL